MNTPSSELGSCRYKMADPDKDDTDYKRILEIFKKYDVRYFFYNGGNDSMDTCDKISRFMEKSGYECRVMGVPKTIDNDLYGTDHCPGFGSAAKYIATSCAEVYKDAHVYDTGMITIIEIMGRHAGWLAGQLPPWPASWAAVRTSSTCPRPTSTWTSSLPTSPASTRRRATASSPSPRASTMPTAASSPRPRPALPTASATPSSAAWPLCSLPSSRRQTGAKVRGIELSLLQRCGAHLASKTDVDEAFMAGEVAVLSAVGGETGKMVAFAREYVDGKYNCVPKLVPLTSVANFEKKVPAEWILPDGKGVTQDFIDYALPLIQGEPERATENSLPRYARLKKVLAK